MQAFDAWVADTVEAVSGIRPRVIACDSRKCALTCELTRVVDLSSPCRFSEQWLIAMLNGEVPTNFWRQFQKQP